MCTTDMALISSGERSPNWISLMERSGHLDCTGTPGAMIAVVTWAGLALVHVECADYDCRREGLVATPLRHRRTSCSRRCRHTCIVAGELERGRASVR